MVSERISQILGVHVQPGKLPLYVEPLDREGKFTKKTMMEIVMAVAEELETMQEKLAALEERMRQDVPSTPPTDSVVEP